MTLSARLWADNGDLAAAALAHPFVSRLGDGSLPREIFAGYVAQQKALTEQVRTGKLYAQFGADGFPEGDVNTPGGADAKLTARAKAIAKEEGVTFEKAYVKACSENPELAAVANTTVANNE